MMSAHIALVHKLDNLLVHRPYQFFVDRGKVINLFELLIEAQEIFLLRDKLKELVLIGKFLNNSIVFVKVCIKLLHLLVVFYYR